MHRWGDPSLLGAVSASILAPSTLDPHCFFWKIEHYTDIGPILYYKTLGESKPLDNAKIWRSVQKATSIELPHLIFVVDRYFPVKKNLYTSKMAAKTGVMQRRPSVVVSDVSVCVILSSKPTKQDPGTFTPQQQPFKMSQKNPRNVSQILIKHGYAKFTSGMKG